MSEQATTTGTAAPEGTQTAQTTTTTTPPAAAPGNTQSTAATVDEAAIIAKAETKAAEVAQSRMEGAFKSMLQQSGLDAEAIAKITEEWKAKQKTPDQIAKEKDDEIARLSGELEQTRNERIAAGRNIPDDLIPHYVRLAEGFDGKDFAEKLDAALVKFPLEKDDAPPPYAAGTGSSSITGQGAEDEFTKRINKYRRN